MSIHNCEECKFITENKRDYQRHIKTKKHQKNVGEIENSKYTINIPQIYHKMIILYMNVTIAILDSNIKVENIDIRRIIVNQRKPQMRI